MESGRVVGSRYVESRRVVYRVVVMFGSVPAESCSEVLCRDGEYWGELMSTVGRWRLEEKRVVAFWFVLRGLVGK